MQDNARTISCNAWNSHVEYTSRESKDDIKKSKDNIFNQVVNIINNSFDSDNTSSEYT